MRAICLSFASGLDHTARGAPLAIAAGAPANAIDPRQSRVTRMIDAGDGANRNLTRLTLLRFMSIDVIAIGLAPDGRKRRTVLDFGRSHGDPAGAQIFERA